MPPLLANAAGLLLAMAIGWWVLEIDKPLLVMLVAKGGADAGSCFAGRPAGLVACTDRRNRPPEQTAGKNRHHNGRLAPPPGGCNLRNGAMHADL